MQLVIFVNLQNYFRELSLRVFERGEWIIDQVEVIHLQEERHSQRRFQIRFDNNGNKLKRVTVFDSFDTKRPLLFDLCHYSLQCEEKKVLRFPLKEKQYNCYYYQPEYQCQCIFFIILIYIFLKISKNLFYSFIFLIVAFLINQNKNRISLLLQ